MSRRLASRMFLCYFVTLASSAAWAQDWSQVDRTVAEVLRKSGAPSASVVVVRDGRTVYRKAAGWAQLQPQRAATPEMRYCIGSISKQFTAAAVLLLAEEGRLSLDDKVSRWFPHLVRSDQVSVRQLLSMTAGYSDFWPQDYAMPCMLQPANNIVETWGRRSLDFEPGTRWQYSNTNYTIAGRIVEQESGIPFFEFLRRRIFQPLHMDSVVDVDSQPLPLSEPGGYRCFALAKPQPAPKEGDGWLFAIGSLAMTASDLARWNQSLIDEALLKPSSYRELERETLLANGSGTRYGLGVSINTVRGRRQISHGGEISGFTAVNSVYPDDGAAISVFTNLDATDAPGQIASKVLEVLFPFGEDDRVRSILLGLQQGRVDRSMFTDNLNHYYSAEALAECASSLGPLGALKELTQLSESSRGGMTFRVYRARFAEATLRVTLFVTSENLFEQVLVGRE